MIARLATFKVNPGKAAELEAAIGWLTAQVREKEGAEAAPLYQLVKSRTDPLLYKMVIVFRDQAAVDAHQVSQHHIDLKPRLEGVLAEKPEAESFDFVG